LGGVCLERYINILTLGFVRFRVSVFISSLIY
jgi:hypothetical protein